MGVTIAAANVHDTKLLKATLDAIVVERPTAEEVAQHLCLDKGYDNPTGHETVAATDYRPHIRSIGEDALAAKKTTRRTKPRRWVVERTLAWLSKCRGILVRHLKKSQNYLGFLQFASALLWFRRIHRLGKANEFPVFG